MLVLGNHLMEDLFPIYNILGIWAGFYKKILMFLKKVRMTNKHNKTKKSSL